MTPEGKKKAIIISSLLIIGGVVGYLLWKRHKEKSVSGSGSTDTGTATDTSTDTKITTNAPVIKSTGGSGMPTDQVMAFQDWMDKNHPNWVNGKNLNKGSGYGNFGPSTSKAWASYGAEYTKKSSTPTAPKPTPTSNERKVWSKSVGTPIYTNVSDTIPYRLAGSGEYVGTTDGTIVKSYWGTPFYKLKWDKNKFVYIETKNASFTA